MTHQPTNNTQAKQSRVTLEHRHSDNWDSDDYGGYTVLRFDGEYVGRVTGYEAADKLLKYIQELESKIEGRHD